MKTVAPPLRDSRADHQFCVDRAVTDEEKAALEACRQGVHDQFDAYALAKGRPHDVTRSNLWPEAKRLEEMWRHRGSAGAIGELWAQTLDAAGRCVFCDYRQAEEADHFLPKSKYPALTVHHLNLVGACNRCNKHKSTIANANPRRQFVHPYLEPIPTGVDFLHCSAFEGHRFVPLYSIDAPADWPDDLATRLAWQFDRLKLSKYYQTEAQGWFKGQSLRWVRAARQGWDVLEQSLTGALEGETLAFSSNTWLAATIRGLLEDPTLRADPVAIIVENGPLGLTPDS